MIGQELRADHRTWLDEVPYHFMLTLKPPARVLPHWVGEGLTADFWV